MIELVQVNPTASANYLLPILIKNAYARITGRNRQVSLVLNARLVVDEFDCGISEELFRERKNHPVGRSLLDLWLTIILFNSVWTVSFPGLSALT